MREAVRHRPVARRRLSEALRAARLAVVASRATPEAQRFLDGVDWKAGAADLAETYERLPEREGGAGWARLSGQVVPEGYRIDLAPGATCPPPGVGSSLVTIRIEPARWQGQSTYRLEARLVLDTGEVAGPAAAEVFARLWRRFGELPADGPEAHFADAEAESRLAPEDRAVLGSLQSSFPRTIRRLLNIYALSDLADPGGGFHLVQTRAPDLAGRAPHLDAYLDRLDDLATLHLSVGDDLFSFDTEDMRLEARARPAATPLGEPSKRRGLASLDVRAAGLAAHVHDLPFEAVWSPTPGSIGLELVLDRMPRSMGVEGKILGIVDKVALEGLSGLDLDRVLRDFLVVMLRGNEGRGTRLALQWGREGERNLLDLRLTTELAGNSAVGTGRRIYSALYVPEDSVTEEIRELGGVLLEGLVLDLEDLGP